MIMAKALLVALTVTAVLPGTAWAAPDGRDRKVVIDNITSATLRELHVSPTNAGQWRKDLLGQRTVASGESIETEIDNGTNECFFDLKAVLSNDMVVEQRNVNVCQANYWTIGDTENSVR